MITYQGGVFGYSILFRLHGSAVFKSLTPSLFSSIVYILLFNFTDLADEIIFDHPYPLAALVSAFSFLLIFRANFAYNRYWEAHTHVHQMHSKWLDFGTEAAAFHYQAERYDKRKPPAFGSHPDVTEVTRERERKSEMTKEELVEHINAVDNSTRTTGSLRKRITRVFRPKLNRNEEAMQSIDNIVVDSPARSGKGSKRVKKVGFLSSKKEKGYNKSDGGGSSTTRYSSFQTVSRKRQRAGHLDPDVPPLFLEETAHLLSLLSAVALSTLRNDLQDAESPLLEFTPSEPWPCADPDDYTADVRKGWAQSSHASYTVMRFLCGVSRTDKSRTLYNAARPFRVIGNVSDAEIELLQAARGPQAKVSLCSMWLQEFVSREHLSGSTGKVAPPIVSRLYQFVSDGMAAYNQARKIAYIPFPFPHAQITSLFVLVIVVFVPVLMLSYVEHQTLGFFLNLFTVMCFTGLHEVARELESPFQNVPNDIPLNNFQAQFNEGLMIMFFGYHPDAYWRSQSRNALIDLPDSMTWDDDKALDDDMAAKPEMTTEVSVAEPLQSRVLQRDEDGASQPLSGLNLPSEGAALL